MSKKGAAALQKDVPWRAASAVKPVPKIHHSPVLRVAQTPYSNYALSVMKHPDPIGNGLGMEAVVEAAGPDCIVPGQVAPIKLLGLKAMQEVQLRKGPWLEHEDERLAAAVVVLGERRWDALAKASGLRRSGKSCRLRWMNYLRPNLKHGHITVDEERVIIELHEKWGNKWSRIARKLPGRTDNEIKNYWRSHLKKKAKVVKKECFSSTISTSTSSDCDTGGTCSNNGESALSKDKNFGSYANSSDAVLELSCLTQSPYEMRLTELMSNWALDTSNMESKDESWNFNIYDHQEWISEDVCSSIILDNYFSLWDGE